MEIWKELQDYPKYLVSNMGNVKSIRGNILRPFDRLKSKYPDSGGYQTVHLVGPKVMTRYQNRTVHSLVMEAFVGPRPEGFVINHINGIKWDNRLENLEYCTISHNKKEDFIRGRQSLAGEKNTQAKLTEKDVLKIVRLYKTGKYTYRSLALLFGVHWCGVSNIFNGHCWSYLTGITCSANPRKKNTF